MLDFLTALLHDLGNASAVVIAIALPVMFVFGFWRGWWVPGYLHEREVKRGDELEAAAIQSTRTVERAAAATESATATALSVANQLTAIAGAVARLERTRREPD